ncbi:Rho GTPase-activating protein [Pseudohyphozyma bogoriensis]|nr:Rho GTPase-activating protein [Pseudohyphozyma bogoriensis]
MSTDLYSSSPPTKASLLKWWKVFSKNSNHRQNSGAGTSAAGPAAAAGAGPYAYQPPGRGLPRQQSGEGRVFGVSLEQSLKYASVAISVVGPDEKPYIYGYVPVVVAKCGMMLKETATATEGIFRVSGSNKRINQLQEVFDSAPRYGKDLDWSPYTQHDAASILRRFLNSMPEPVIPQHLYVLFTDVLERRLPLDTTISEYRDLIHRLPPTSRYLLLYLLDFLSVFSRCSDRNLMTSSNLAVVFQPGLVSSRKEGASDALLGFPGFPGGQLPKGMSSEAHGVAAEEGKGEHGRAKEVLEFLIDNQGSFMLGLEPPKKEQLVRVASPTSLRGAAAEEGESKMAVESPVLGAVVGATELSRRGSEKSVERRRLRKSHDGGNAKVKRSKSEKGTTGTPGRRRQDAAGGSSTHSPRLPDSPATNSSSSPNPNNASPSSPTVGIFRSRSKKVKREEPPAPTSPPATVARPTSPSTTAAPASQPVDIPMSSASPVTSRSDEKEPRSGGWSPPWRGRKSMDGGARPTQE